MEVGSMKRIIIFACALFLLPGAPAVAADTICAPLASNSEKPLREYLAYYRSIAAAEPDERLYVQAEKDFAVSNAWMKSQFDNPKIFQNDCDPKIIHQGDLLVYLSANVEFRHDPSLIHAVVLRTQTDLVIGDAPWILADPALGKPFYRFLLHGVRDAYTAGEIPMGNTLKAALSSYP
jgi:hypothetical protein